MGGRAHMRGRAHMPGCGEDMATTEGRGGKGTDMVLGAWEEADAPHLGSQHILTIPCVGELAFSEVKPLA